MTTVAYCAVSREGRSAPGEIVLCEEAVPGLRRLADAVHEEGAAVSAQIGHAGPVAGAGQKGVAPSRVFSPVAFRWMRAASADDIGRITDEFANGARLVAEAGFDAVEVHLGHGYLLSSFLSPRLNKRNDRWGGGSIENRARFPRAVVAAIREAVGEKVAVLVKLNMADGVRGGLWLDESVEVGRMLQSDGTVDAIELTAGSSFQNPMYLFRGPAPIPELAAAMPRLMGWGIRVAGKRFLRSYQFAEAFLLPFARRFREELDMALILLGGINRVETIRRAMEEGFEFVAMARALLMEPDLVQRMQAGATAEAQCIHCNKCMATIYSGTRCVLVGDGR